MNILFGSAKDELAELLERHGYRVCGRNERGQYLVEKKGPERGLDFYFPFFIALFVLAGVIGIIWLMVAVKLF
jgi:hypothetical protein